MNKSILGTKERLLKYKKTKAHNILNQKMVVTTSFKENKYMVLRGYPIKINEELIGWMKECEEEYPPIDLEPVWMKTENLRYSEVNGYGPA